MPRTIVIESYEEFRRRHTHLVIKDGDEEFRRHVEPVVTDTGEVLFADGATADSSRELRREPPPEGTVDYYRARRRYLETKLQQEEKRFHDAQFELVYQAQSAANFPGSIPPPEGAATVLKRKARHVKVLRVALAAVQRLLSETPQAELDRMHQEERARASARADDIGAEIASVSLND